MGFNVELFKIKASEDEMNDSMMVLAEILRKEMVTIILMIFLYQ